MTLNTWARRHSIPPLAIAELRALMGTVDTSVPVIDGLSETAVQSRVRRDMTRNGDRVFRNNVGMLYTDRGVPVRFGLANDTKAMNSVIKSSDLIGIRPVVILPSMVGATIGQFLAREVKKEGWVYTGEGREPAQLKFHELITSLGGDAKFTTGEI